MIVFANTWKNSWEAMKSHESTKFSFEFKVQYHLNYAQICSFFTKKSVTVNFEIFPVSCSTQIRV